MSQVLDVLYSTVLRGVKAIRALRVWSVRRRRRCGWLRLWLATCEAGGRRTSWVHDRDPCCLRQPGQWEDWWLWSWLETRLGRDTNSKD
jgi:hypothetical protein